MCGNIKSLSVWEGHELVILALEIKECLNFADSPSGGLPDPNLSLLKVHDCLRLKSLPENMDTLLPSLQILDFASCQQVESFPVGVLPTNMNCLAIDASEKLITNRNQWGLKRLHYLNQLLLSCHDCREQKCFPEEDFHKS
ncbi:hypothetical protein CMV_028078 [Castanea mollissima]|uniref:Disease resistance protein n=1 Tax=Castanea mollissima TaxID=60419 RepID=A0A8J4QGZ1_9ROSI|nr:hypothetical protein CMV_028078 [Castanea mollissima]